VIVVRGAVRDLIEAGLNEAASAGAYGFCAFGPLLNGPPTGPIAVLMGTGLTGAPSRQRGARGREPWGRGRDGSDDDPSDGCGTARDAGIAPRETSARSATGFGQRCRWPVVMTYPGKAGSAGGLR
jgi:hypothetical protein